MDAHYDNKALSVSCVTLCQYNRKHIANFNACYGRQEAQRAVGKWCQARRFAWRAGRLAVTRSTAVLGGGKVRPARTAAILAKA